MVQSGCQTNVTLFPPLPLLPHTRPQHPSCVPQIHVLPQAPLPGWRPGRHLHLHGNGIFFLPRHLRFTIKDTTSGPSPRSRLWGLTTDAMTAHVNGQLPLPGHVFKGNYFMLTFIGDTSLPRLQKSFREGSLEKGG